MPEKPKNGEFSKSVILIGQIDRAKALESGSFTPQDLLDEMDLDGQLRVKEGIVTALHEELDRFWSPEIDRLILHGDEVFLPMVGWSEFDFSGFADEKEYVTISIIGPKQVGYGPR